MPSPHLHDLPPPPVGKSGWPWTEESKPIPDQTPSGRGWPRITIVTPSYNQGEFIEETIRSVLLQEYPNLEYIVIDGGSTDNSVAIIKKYEPWLAYWISEPDTGQAQAINKGFQKASGSIFGWLNSDDFFFPDALNLVGSLFSTISEPTVLVGEGDIVGKDGEFLRAITVPNLDPASILAWEEMFLQQACFWSAQCWREVGALDEDFHLLLDVDLWIRFSRSFPFIKTSVKLGALRWYPQAKTVKYRARSLVERCLIDFRYGQKKKAIARLESTLLDCHANQQQLSEMMQKLPVRVLRRLRFI